MSYQLQVSVCKFWPVEEGTSMSFGQYSLRLTTKYSEDAFTVLKMNLSWTEGIVSKQTHMTVHDTLNGSNHWILRQLAKDRFKARGPKSY